MLNQTSCCVHEKSNECDVSELVKFIVNSGKDKDDVKYAALRFPCELS
jgi:hypothetical protein